MPVTWSDASLAVLATAQELIALYHPRLAEANIGFVFRSEPAASGGKDVIAHVGKVPLQLSPYIDLDYLIWIVEDSWNSFSESQRQALLDHELYHCVPKADGTFGLRSAHDVEEFIPILERYGLWNSDLAVAAPAMNQAVQLDLGLLPKETRQGRLMAVSAKLMGE